MMVPEHKLHPSCSSYFALLITFWDWLSRKNLSLSLSFSLILIDWMNQHPFIYGMLFTATFAPVFPSSYATFELISIRVPFSRQLFPLMPFCNLLPPLHVFEIWGRFHGRRRQKILRNFSGKKVTTKNVCIEFCWKSKKVLHVFR